MPFTKSCFTTFYLLIFFSGVAYAGGPLRIEGANGHTPATYADPNIVLNLDNGPLGNRTKADADTLIMKAFALWNNIITSTIHFSKGADLNKDIDQTNFLTVLPNSNNTILHEQDGLTPIVYDSDGSIIDAFFGGANPNNPDSIPQSSITVGFAASIIFSGQNNFVEGYAVINGKPLPGFDDLTTELTIAHELGHLIGLDHTQTNINNSESQLSFPLVCTTANNTDDYPLMYPFICRNSESLHADDISAVSALYPASNLTQNFGTISGFFVDTAGKAILGANIWAENTTTGEAISTVSDYLEERNGAYTLLLPAGKYTLHANSINPEFNAGSGIGPYTKDAFDLSFQNPHPITPVAYQSNASSGNAAIITVNNGSNINIVFAVDGNTGTVAPAAAQSSGGGGGGSGSLSPLYTLFLTLSLLVIRRKF